MIDNIIHCDGHNMTTMLCVSHAARRGASKVFRNTEQTLSAVGAEVLTDLLRPFFAPPHKKLAPIEWPFGLSAAQRPSEAVRGRPRMPASLGQIKSPWSKIKNTLVMSIQCVKGYARSID